MKLSPGGHHSLPRKKTPLDVGRGNPSSSANVQQQQQQFQRGQPLRRSCLSPTQYQHYQQQQQQQQSQQLHHHQHRQQDSSLHFEYFVPRSVSEFNLAAAAVADMAVPPPPPASVLRPSSALSPPVVSGIAGTSQARLLDGGNTRSREKMVTFEDEGVSCVTSTPTRKNLSGLDNVFM